MDDMHMLLMVFVAILLIFVVIIMIGFILHSLHKTFGFEMKWIFRKNSRSADRRQAVHYRMTDNNQSRVDRVPTGEQKQRQPNGDED